MAAVDFSTLAARLSSFEASVKFSRKTVKWSRDAPSPADLAAAGFFWKPSASSHDNTQCFLCGRALDNWEKDDLPLAEHLKHSPDCGWATVKSVGQEGFDRKTMEDPTGTRLSEARRATFMDCWPHEDKRGWLCKTERLVQAGWFYAPAPDSDDYVSCAYCKLSLDGFEPKDNPFDEHYRRSPDCPFFVFAGTTAPKSTRRKESRTTKASRFSTQSTVTSTSEVPSIPDLDESIDASTLSMNTVASSVSAISITKNNKTKGRRTKGSRAQENESTEEPPTMVQEEGPEADNEFPRGSKRTSDLMSEDDRGCRESTAKPEPVAKRRNTRTQASVADPVNYPVLEVEGEPMAVEPAPSKPARGGKKRAPSRSRKTSTLSTAAVSAAVPDNAAIEAELEADLGRPMSDEEKPTVVEEVPPKRGRKPKATSVLVASAGGKRPASSEHQVPESDTRTDPVDNSESQVTHHRDVEGPAPTRARSTKNRTSKKNATRQVEPNKRGSAESTATLATELETHLDSSMVAPRTEADDSGHETDASAGGKSAIRKGGKRKANTKGRGRKVGTGVMSKNIEDIVQSHLQAQSNPPVVAAAGAEPGLTVAPSKGMEEKNVDGRVVQTTADVEACRQDEQVPEQPAQITAKTGKAKLANGKKPKAVNKPPQLSMPGAFSPLMPEREQDIEPSFASVLSPTSPPVLVQPLSDNGAAARRDTAAPNVPEGPPQLPPRSPLRNMASSARSTPIPQRNNMPRGQKETTPSPSPQPSDAENLPPSARPSSARPPLAALSPSKNQSTRVALAPETRRPVPLSPSKIGGGLRSDIPWTSVDVEMVFATTTPGTEKENLDVLDIARGALTSPEKKMTVEEWINWNAGKAEERLRAESERVVGVFEKEGTRALRVLEGIEVLD